MCHTVHSSVILQMRHSGANASECTHGFGIEPYFVCTIHSVVVAKKPESIRHEILNTSATKSHARYVCNLMLNDRVTSYVMAGAQTV